MSLADLTSKSAVLSAVREYDSLGRERFLATHGFGPAKVYFLDINGRLYDSKAIVGVAYGYQFPQQGPLKSRDFSGGHTTVETKLVSLGFKVRVLRSASRQEDCQHQPLADLGNDLSAPTHLEVRRV